MFISKFFLALTFFTVSIGAHAYEPLTQKERGDLEKATSSSPTSLLEAKAGSTCNTTWSTDPNSGQQTAHTVCDDSSSSSSGPASKMGPGFFRGCLAGGFGGALLGSLAGGAGAGIGAAIGCVGVGIGNKMSDE